MELSRFIKLEVVFEYIGPLIYLANIVGHCLLPTLLHGTWMIRQAARTQSLMCLYDCVCEVLSCSGNAVVLSCVSRMMCMLNTDP
jgi:hypothetical protein